MTAPPPRAVDGPAELTPEELSLVQHPREVTVVGRDVLFVVHVPGGEKPAASSDVWSVRAGNEPYQLTFGPSVDSLPRLAPDGRLLAFASDRESAGTSALFVTDLGDPTRSAHRIGQFTGSVEEIRWAADGTDLIVLAADPGAETGSAFGGRAIADARGPLSHSRRCWRRLHRVDVVTGHSAEIGPEGSTVWEFGWHGYGTLAAILSEDPSESGWFDARVAVLDIDRRTAHTVYEPKWQVQNVIPDSDGQKLAFTEAPQSDRGLLAGQPVIINLADYSVIRPELDIDVTRLRWISDGRLFWTGIVGTRTACGFITIGHQPEPHVEVDERWRGLATLGGIEHYVADCDEAGSLIAAVVEAHGLPPEVRVLDETGGAQWRALTSFNVGLSERPSPDQLEYTWMSSDQVSTIEGLLLLPRQRQSNEPLPLVIWAHGGPTNAHTSLFAPALYAGEALILAQRGCAVLLPNPRGSTGRGLAFMSANIGDLGGDDLQDLLDAVTALVEDGLVDPGRVGIAGASYGGFMSAWAAVRTNVFAASVPISSITNWLSHRNTSGLARFDDIYLGGDPQEPEGPYLRQSPVMYARGTTTPTLFIHGDSDRSCPVGQSQELFQALSETGCETDFVSYPGEGHEICERAHVLDASARTVAWFTRYLGLADNRSEP